MAASARVTPVSDTRVAAVVIPFHLFHVTCGIHLFRTPTQPRFHSCTRVLNETPTHFPSYRRCTHMSAYTHALCSCFILLCLVSSVCPCVSYFPFLCVFVLCAGLGYLLRTCVVISFFLSCVVVWATFFVLVYATLFLPH